MLGRFLPLFVALLLCSISVEPLHAAPAKASQDTDLSRYPAYYQKRIKKFRRIIRAEKTKEAKIGRAVKLARTPASQYRKDAIRFLVEVHAVETTSKLIRLGRKYPALRDEVAVAMGRFQTKAAIGYLIECLADKGKADNVRSIAIHNLRNLTNQSFGYRPDFSEPERRKGYTAWKEWWKANRKTFKKLEPTHEDREEADEIWQKYGLRYLGLDQKTGP